MPSSLKKVAVWPDDGSVDMADIRIARTMGTLSSEEGLAHLTN